MTLEITEEVFTLEIAEEGETLEIPVGPGAPSDAVLFATTQSLDSVAKALARSNIDAAFAQDVADLAAAIALQLLGFVAKAGDAMTGALTLADISQTLKVGAGGLSLQRASGQNLGVGISGANAAYLGDNGMGVATGRAVTFTSSADARSSVDAGLSRGAAGQVNVGNGTAADYSGSLQLASVMFRGASGFAGDATWAVNGDTNSRLRIGLSGDAPIIAMGPGNATRDLALTRGAAGQFNVGNGAAGDFSGSVKAASFLGAVGGQQLAIISGNQLVWATRGTLDMQSDGAFRFGNNANSFLVDAVVEANGVFAFRRGTTAAGLRVYGTTDGAIAPTNYRRWDLDANGLFANSGGTGGNWSFDFGTGAGNSGAVFVNIQGARKWQFTTTEHLIPQGNQSQDLGDGTHRLRDGYINRILNSSGSVTIAHGPSDDARIQPVNSGDPIIGFYDFSTTRRASLRSPAANVVESRNAANSALGTFRAGAFFMDTSGGQSVQASVSDMLLFNGNSARGLGILCDLITLGAYTGASTEVRMAGSTAHFTFTSDASYSTPTVGLSLTVDGNFGRKGAGQFCFGTGARGNDDGQIRLAGVRLKPRTFATLPTPVAGDAGLKMAINDAGALTYGGAAAGGGSNYAPVENDGSTWRYF